MCLVYPAANWKCLRFGPQIRQQNRQDMKTAGPQSQVLASVLTGDSPPVNCSLSSSRTVPPSAAEFESKSDVVHQSPVSPPEVPAEPEPPNPFNQLTDQELEEYRKEVQRKQDGGSIGRFFECTPGLCETFKITQLWSRWQESTGAVAFYMLI